MLGDHLKIDVNNLERGFYEHYYTTQQYDVVKGTMFILSLTTLYIIFASGYILTLLKLINDRVATMVLPCKLINEWILMQIQLVRTFR